MYCADLSPVSRIPVQVADHPLWPFLVELRDGPSHDSEAFTVAPTAIPLLSQMLSNPLLMGLPSLLPYLPVTKVIQTPHLRLRLLRPTSSSSRPSSYIFRERHHFIFGHACLRVVVTTRFMARNNLIPTCPKRITIRIDLPIEREQGPG